MSQISHTSKKTIAVFTSIEGHASLAEAVSQAFDKVGYQVEVFSYEDPLFEIYRQIYIHKPSLFSHIYRASNNNAFENLSKLVIKSKSSYSRKVEKFIQTVRPNALISTYFGFNPTLEKISNKQNIPFFNLVCNPHTISYMEVAKKANCNFVFDQHASQQVAQIKPQATTRAIGWLVRDSYEKSYNQKNLRKQLGLQPNLTTLFFVSGSEGTNTIWETLDPLMHSLCPAQIIVACGRNKAMFGRLQLLQAELEANNSSIQLVVLPFTDSSPFIKAADLVIGKAGPNTLFEAVAAHKPFFATTHISGQEDGNLDIIRQNQLGWVEENPSYALVKILNLLHNPKKLQEHSKSIAKMANYNKQSKQKLLEIVETAINNPSV
ncbi:MAG: glycosyltransferase [Patescibacteria group bacterium]